MAQTSRLVGRHFVLECLSSGLQQALQYRLALAHAVKQEDSGHLALDAGHEPNPYTVTLQLPGSK